MMGGTTHWLRSLWRILGGRRLAVILLVALLLASLLASLFPQLPTDPTSREVWLEAVTLRYGAVTSLLRTLGLFDAYHSPWFLALLAALLVNTAVCTVQRLPRLWRTLTEPPIIARSEAFYQSLAHRAEWMVASRREGLAAAQDTLRQRRYRTHLENDQAAGWASLYGERGRWSQAGTLVSHLAGALLVICVAARPALSWQERGVTLLPKQVYPIGHGYDLALRAGRLGPERSLDKAPLAILADAAVVITETARINQPFTYQGVAFHLQGYGPAAQISTPEGTLSVAFSG
ncbi:MAG: cytochrome c biogenesis protein ResB, partial [Anaerolineae bacterium]